jgi:hypothetical protein
MSNETSPPRAPRMPLHLPLRYRRAGERSWTEAVTQNISRTGVLFSSPNGVTDDETIEVELRFPFVHDIHAPGGRVRAHARIVRHAQFLGLDGRLRTALAAAFLDYDLTPRA